MREGFKHLALLPLELLLLELPGLKLGWPTASKLLLLLLLLHHPSFSASLSQPHSPVLAQLHCGTCAAVDGRSGPIVLQRCLDRTSRVRKCRVCLDAPPRLLWHLMSVHAPAETAAAAAVGVGLLMAAPHSLWMRRGFPRPASADRTRAHGQRGSLDVLRRRLMLVPWGLLHGGVEGVHGCEGG